MTRRRRLRASPGGIRTPNPPPLPTTVVFVWVCPGGVWGGTPRVDWGPSLTASRDSGIQVSHTHRIGVSRNRSYIAVCQHPIFFRNPRPWYGALPQGSERKVFFHLFLVVCATPSLHLAERCLPKVLKRDSPKGPCTKTYILSSKCTHRLLSSSFLWFMFRIL